jgi:hypothetical protein
MEEETKQNASENTQSGKSDLGGALAQFEKMLDEYLVKNAPFAIPEGGKEFIVTVSPYLIIVFAIMAIPIILAALGLTAFLTPFAMMGGSYTWGFSAIVSLAVSVVTLILDAMAVPGLFKRTKASWRLLFYASIVSFVGGIISLSGIIGTIIGAVIGWYILFQVKDKYKN